MYYCTVPWGSHRQPVVLFRDPVNCTVPWGSHRQPVVLFRDSVNCTVPWGVTQTTCCPLQGLCKLYSTLGFTQTTFCPLQGPCKPCSTPWAHQTTFCPLLGPCKLYSTLGPHRQPKFVLFWGPVNCRVPWAHTEDIQSPSGILYYCTVLLPAQRTSSPLEEPCSIVQYPGLRPPVPFRVQFTVPLDPQRKPSVPYKDPVHCTVLWAHTEDL